MICSRFCLFWISIALLLLYGGMFTPAAQADQPTPSPSWNVEQGIELPIYKTPWEIENEHLFPIQYPPTDDPPPPPVCNPAEWEPMSGVLIRYPFGIPINLIAEMSEDVEVKTIVANTSQMNTVLSQYSAGGVNIANCTFLIAPSNSYWTRDYGPWYIFTGNNVQGITDHIYNRPTRPDDNNIPWVLGASLNIPVYGMSLIHTGGNYMSDGMGIAMSTDLVYNENPNLTHAQVDDYIYQFTGNDYMVVPDISSSGIHHIDCWGKLLSPGKIMVKQQVPTNTQLEANAAFFASQISSYRRPYEVVRVVGGSSQDYTNALILNNKVLVPLFGSSYDAAAMQVWQQAMPGYEVLGFTGSWVNDDAIHCRVMGITDRYMLRIVHVPVFDQINTAQGYAVGAQIHAYSNMPFINNTPAVIWKPAGGSYTALPMTHVSGDSFAAYIPQQPDYTTIYYYIHAEDDSGRSENHPYIGPGDPHHFQVLPEAPLAVTLTPQNPPIVIPANGGSFNYTIYVSNTGSGSVNFDGWIEAVLPSGNVFGVLSRLGLALPAGGSLTRSMTQTVPASAPPGNYTYRMRVGQYSSVVYAEDSFPFQKSTLDGGGFAATGWTTAGWGESEDRISALIQGFQLGQNYPNPFNPTTTIQFTLPLTARVLLTVADVQGRTVATLVDGYREAGRHEVTWDAGNLASGIYFCRMDAGAFTAAQKMMLVK